MCHRKWEYTPRLRVVAPAASADVIQTRKYSARGKIAPQKIWSIRRPRLQNTRKYGSVPQKVGVYTATESRRPSCICRCDPDEEIFYPWEDSAPGSVGVYAGCVCPRKWEYTPRRRVVAPAASAVVVLRGSHGRSSKCENAKQMCSMARCEQEPEPNGSGIGQGPNNPSQGTSPPAR